MLTFFRTTFTFDITLERVYNYDKRQKCTSRRMVIGVKNDIMIKKSHKKNSELIIELRKTFKGHFQEITFRNVGKRTTKKKEI